MAEEIKKGDLVKLKTLSTHLPVMVVDVVYGDDSADCVWYNAGTAEVKRVKLFLTSLVKVS